MGGTKGLSTKTEAPAAEQATFSRAWQSRSLGLESPERAPRTSCPALPPQCCSGAGPALCTACLPSHITRSRAFPLWKLPAPFAGAETKMPEMEGATPSLAFCFPGPYWESLPVAHRESPQCTVAGSQDPTPSPNTPSLINNPRAWGRAGPPGSRALGPYCWLQRLRDG